MRVRSILNNNAVVAEMGDGTEAIVMGAGIGFGLKKSDLIPQALVQKVYEAQSSKHRALIHVLDSIDSVYLEIAAQIVEEAGKQTHQEYSPFLLIELADHIASALDRARRGITLANLLVEEVKTLYPAEYAVGQQALTWIAQKTRYELDEVEAGFIAMHLISSQARYYKKQKENQSVALTTKMLSLIHKHYGLVIQKDQILHVRFLTHLKFLAARILQGKALESEKISKMYSSVTYTEKDISFAAELREHIKRKYSYMLCEDEIFYILIHLQAILH